MKNNTILLLAEGGAFANVIINSPLEQFEVLNLISINAPIFGFLNLSLTNLGLITIKLLSLFSFVFFLILDYFIKNNYLGNSIKNFYFKFIIYQIRCTDIYHILFF